MILRIMQVKAALMRGVDVDLTNTAGWTALHAAAAGGHTKILDVLLRADADINIRDRGGNLPVISQLY
jgi:ankyrin repeat protein